MKINKFTEEVIKELISEEDENIFVSKSVISNWLKNKSNQKLLEISIATWPSFGKPVDDGPGLFLKDLDTYKGINAERAAKLGWHIISHLANDTVEDYNELRNIGYVTNFEIGVPERRTETDRYNMMSGKSYNDWLDGVTDSMALVGYSVLQDKYAQKELELQKKLVKKDILTHSETITTQELEEIKNNLIEAMIGISIDAGEPNPSYTPDGLLRLLDRGKPEPWFKQLGYTQVDKPRASFMRGRLKKDQPPELQTRKVSYKVQNVKTSTLKPALKPVGSTEWVPANPDENMDKFKKRKSKNKPKLKEDLRKWLGSGPTGGWDRYSTTGEKLGKCGDAKEGEPYSVCLSNEKARKLGKKGIASFVRRKRDAQKKAGDAKKGGEQKKGQKPIKVKTGANEEMTPQQHEKKGMPLKGKVNVNEAKQVGIIYHYTTFEYGLKILQSNKLKADHAADGTNAKPVYAVSFTRDKRFHNNHNVGFTNTSFGQTPQVRFTVNGNKLSNKYEVQPYSQGGVFNKGKRAFEAEERVTSDKPFYIPLSNYLVSVDILVEYKKPKDEYDWDAEYDYKTYGPLYAKIVKFTQDKNIPINLVVNKNGDPWPDKAKKTFIQKILNWFNPKKLEERLNLFLEKNEPTNPKNWSYAITQAKKKFDVYPSAYANAWAAKKYKELGGKWKTAESHTLTEIPYSDLKQIDQFADKQLSPLDIVITDKHFFDRLNDPRNDKPISSAELVGFFKRLSKNKKKFIQFLKQYGQIVAKDNRTNINIPFMNVANRVIAKTVMRKSDFKSSNPKLSFETLMMGYPDQKWIDDHNKELKRLRTKFDDNEDDYYTPIDEDITLDVNIGDTILMGKFKNKKVVVKSIGTDDHGMPTINGKKVVNFRKLLNNTYETEKKGLTEAILWETFKIVNESGTFTSVEPIPTSIVDDLLKDFLKKLVIPTKSIDVKSIIGIGSTRSILNKLPNAKKVAGDLDLLAISTEDIKTSVNALVTAAKAKKIEHLVSFGNVTSFAWPYDGKFYQIDLMLSERSPNDNVYNYMAKFKYWSDEDPNQSRPFLIKGAHRSQLVKTLVKAVGLSAAQTDFEVFKWNDEFTDTNQLADILEKSAQKFKDPIKKQQTLDIVSILRNKIKDIPRLKNILADSDGFIKNRFPHSIFRNYDKAWDVLIDKLFVKVKTGEDWDKVMDKKFKLSNSIDRMKTFDDALEFVDNLLKRKIITPRSAIEVFRDLRDKFDNKREQHLWTKELELFIEKKFPFLVGRW